MFSPSLGVSKPMIGDDFTELMTVGGVLFFVSLVCDFDTSDNVRRVLYGLATTVDVGTLVIALQSLRRTIEVMEKEKQSQKLKVLVQLRNVLVLVAGAWMGFNLLWKQRHADSLGWWMQDWFYKDGASILCNSVVLARAMVGERGVLRGRCFWFRANVHSFMRPISSWKWKRELWIGVFVDGGKVDKKRFEGHNRSGWCSGYHARFTRERSRVQSSHPIFFSFHFSTNTSSFCI